MGNKGLRAFEDFYGTMYAERWLTLKKALLSDSIHVPIPGLREDYFLDPASLLTAGCLGVEPGQRVLDMCAAPGGKSLVLALMLRGDGSLIANERSATRRGRLRHVIENCLPPEYAAAVTVTGHDATKWGLFEQEKYDRILVDVPCSSERHVLLSPEHLEQWGSNRPRQLAMQAFAILAAALDALVVGGVLVYSTCALNTGENDDVVGKLLKKRAGCCSVQNIDVPEIPGDPEGMQPEAILASADKTEFGYHILPDRAFGAGPMYLSRIEKTASSDKKARTGHA